MSVTWAIDPSIELGGVAVQEGKGVQVEPIVSDSGVGAAQPIDAEQMASALEGVEEAQVVFAYTLGCFHEYLSHYGGMGVFEFLHDVVDWAAETRDALVEAGYLRHDPDA